MVHKVVIALTLIITSFQVHTSSAEEYKHLVALGDSIPYGYNLEEDNNNPQKDAFPYIIGSEKNVEVTNMSIPGLTSRELLSAVKSNDKLRRTIRNADYVLVYIGGNDLLNLVKKNKGIDGIKIEQVAPVIRDFIYNMYSIIIEVDKLTDGKVLVYNLYNPYPSAGDKLNAPLYYLNLQYASLIKLMNHFTSIQLIDVYQSFKGHPEYIIKGDVHPTKEGQKALAELTIPHIQ
ncbi:GDSL-type esterase/lipase family protein [Halobacillus mangrovi]|uniref:SGNH/GDSL hydrolase family protein n=1 Tax=Halobacillus mangrovi TaxID=402384 RepID=A0A1W5ZRC2_9BACI|nr:GDSL-type esterase/lipase family protein [Halobacillus mangrovi]ARI75831.1 SGNH/GDSL hydrolase family protein [Halobacillus mangrovi]